MESTSVEEREEITFIIGQPRMPLERVLEQEKSFRVLQSRCQVLDANRERSAAALATGK